MQLMFAYLLIITGFYLVFSVFSPREERATLLNRYALNLEGDKKGVKLSALRIKYALLNILNNIGYVNTPIIKKTKIGAFYAKKIDTAGLKIAPEGFFAIKELAAVFGFTVLFTFMEQRLSFVILGMFGLFFIPDFFLFQMIKKRKNEILRILPETVDLLSLCVSAGLDFMGAIRWVTGSKFRYRGPLVEELNLVREEINLGKPRVNALKDMERRLAISEVSSLVRTLIASEKMGVPVAEALKNFSQDSRERRFHRGERQARMASIKILFPLIFFILPTIGIIIIGPILMRFMNQGFMQF